MKKTVRIGSRDSKLAVIQSEIVINAIKKKHPQIEIELVTMKTTGDKILDRNLDKIGGKGLFVKELDKALAEGKIDFSVHSLKDLPMEINNDLPIIGFSEREDPRDALLLKKGVELPLESGVVGSSSKRRIIQLKKWYPNIEFKGIRGNVQTRLRKLEEEDYVATVLAAAGLIRLGEKTSSFIASKTCVSSGLGPGWLSVSETLTSVSSIIGTLGRNVGGAILPSGEGRAIGPPAPCGISSVFGAMSPVLGTIFPVLGIILPGCPVGGVIIPF